MKTFYTLVSIPYPLTGYAAAGLPGAAVGLVLVVLILMVCIGVAKLGR